MRGGRAIQPSCESGEEAAQAAEAASAPAQSATGLVEARLGALRGHSLIISAMVEWQPPQTPPAPHARVTSRRDWAPPSIARRTCFSETP